MWCNKMKKKLTGFVNLLNFKYMYVIYLQSFAPWQVSFIYLL